MPQRAQSLGTTVYETAVWLHGTVCEVFLTTPLYSAFCECHCGSHSFLSYFAQLCRALQFTPQLLIGCCDTSMFSS